MTIKNLFEPLREIFGEAWQNSAQLNSDKVTGVVSNVWNKFMIGLLNKVVDAWNAEPLFRDLVINHWPSFSLMLAEPMQSLVYVWDTSAKSKKDVYTLEHPFWIWRLPFMRINTDKDCAVDRTLNSLRVFGEPMSIRYCMW